MNIKNILLIGRTGGGKSTLGNVLINQNNNFEEVFKESAGSVSQTKNIQVQEFLVNLRRDETEQVRYLVVDTAGFGDTQLTNKEILQLLEELVKYIGNDGINQIFFVSGGRFTKEEVEVYGLLETVLFDQEVFKHTTIVRTNFPNFEDEQACERDREAMKRENPEMADIINSVKKIIYVDNPPLTGRVEVVEINRETRKMSREILTMYLMGCQEIYKPNNLNELNQRINDYQTKTEQLQKELQNKEKVRQQRETQLQQQINSLQNQLQNELNRTSQNFNNQLSAAYSEQQRQISEINERHQKEMNELRQRFNQQNYELRCENGHLATEKSFVDACFDFGYCSICERYASFEFHAIGTYNYAEHLAEEEREKNRQLASLVEEINRQISQRQQSINNQRQTEQNRINQRYQQTENNLRSEITRQNQEQVNEQRRYEQELDKIKNEYNQYIEQRTPPRR